VGIGVKVKFVEELPTIWYAKLRKSKKLCGLSDLYYLRNMKILVSILSLLLSASLGFGQIILSPNTWMNKSSAVTKKQDIVKGKLREQLSKLANRSLQDSFPANSMPNAITKKLPPDVYAGNNGNGSDIYRSQLDGMAILKPDSSFASHMPVTVKRSNVNPPFSISGSMESGTLKWLPTDSVRKLRQPKNYRFPKK
jgi:hypothetical protein